MAEKLFEIQTDKIENGSMLMYNNTALTSWIGDLNSLTNGVQMFYGCTALTSFTSNLGSLKSGYNMFTDSRLNTESLRNIADNINNLVEKGYDRENDEHWTYELFGATETIHEVYRGRIDIDLDSSVTQEVIIECGNTLIGKGWDVYVNGVQYIEEIKYKGCKTVDDIIAVDPDYKTNDIIDGVWSERLDDFEQGGNGNPNGGMFYDCTALTTFNSNLSSLTDGRYMFNGCTALTTFNSNLSSLTNGRGMFSGSGLTSFSLDLPSLKYGTLMFSGSGLTSFNVDLPNLTTGAHMFYDCYGLTSFTSDLSSMTSGERMFRYCSNLESFSSDLSSLTHGYFMFEGCTKLTTFYGNLSSLRKTFMMFEGCKLDTASVQNIADTINTYDGMDVNNGQFDIGIGNSEPNEQEKAAFNKIASKGWTVCVTGSDGNSSSWLPTALTPIDGEETTSPIPFYAKPVQSNEEHAQYTDSEGNYYNILGGQFIYGDDLSTYGMFLNKEDAAANMRLTKIEK